MTEFQGSGKDFEISMKRKEESTGRCAISGLHGRSIGLKEENRDIDYTYLPFFSFVRILWPSFPRSASAVHFFVATVEGRKKTG